MKLLMSFLINYIYLSYDRDYDEIIIMLIFAAKLILQLMLAEIKTLIKYVIPLYETCHF